MRKILALIILAFAFTAPVVAEELTEAKRADIRALMQLSGSDQFRAQYASAVAQQIRSAMEQQIPVQKQKAMGIVDETLTDWVQQFAANEALQKELEALYARRFTHKEIRELVSFYKSPLGQKVIKEMPEISGERARIAQGVVQTKMPALEKEMQRRFDEAGIAQAPGQQ